MSQYLPVNDFIWESRDEYMNINFIKSIPYNSPRDYIYEVDLEYPSHLHDVHNDLPFCAESKNPPRI